MNKLRKAAKQNVVYLEQDGLEVLCESEMVLMKDKKTGKHVIVDASGTAWNVEKMWK